MYPAQIPGWDISIVCLCIWSSYSTTRLGSQIFWFFRVLGCWADCKNSWSLTTERWCRHTRRLLLVHSRHFQIDTFEESRRRWRLLSLWRFIDDCKTLFGERRWQSEQNRVQDGGAMCRVRLVPLSPRQHSTYSATYSRHYTFFVVTLGRYDVVPVDRRSHWPWLRCVDNWADRSVMDLFCWLGRAKHNIRAVFFRYG